MRFFYKRIYFKVRIKIASRIRIDKSNIQMSDLV
jgi:hypothetical protein